jgi:hypothetical protein
MKGLVIDEPWIGLILGGKKTWEMRKTACHQRGLVALIRKGSGKIIGVAEIVDSFPPLETTEAYANAEAFHQIPPTLQGRAPADGWRTPWVLKNARSLAAPVPYRHPNGAVIWVKLDAPVIAAVKASLDDGVAAVQSIASVEAAHLKNTPQPIEGENELTDSATTRRPRVNGRIEGDRCIIPITAGNIKNNHIYLRTVLGFFPSDAIGGSDETQRAPRELTLFVGAGRTIRTDIAGPDQHERDGRSAHYFFRNARSGVLHPFF